MMPVAEMLTEVGPGAEIAVRNLAMVPLLRAAAATAAPDYSLLDDALARRTVDITEVSEHGSVPELLVVNRGPEPVLIVDGEELVGAKQNRVVNLTILVPAAAKLKIPVSCVEAGRWHARSRAFSSAPRAQYATGRAKRIKHVSLSMWTSGARTSDQANVWADIAEKSERLHVTSPTSAMNAMYLDHAAAIDEYVNACRPVDRQVGALFTIGGAIIGFDLFDREETLRRLLPKLVRSVAIDAIDRNDSSVSWDAGGSPARSGLAVPVVPLAQLFLAAVRGAQSHTAKAIGLGDDIRVSAPGITGAALVAAGTMIHLAAFNDAPAQ